MSEGWSCFVFAATKLPTVIATLRCCWWAARTHIGVEQLGPTGDGASDSSQVVVVPGAGHLFEGPGQLGRVAELTVEWFRTHMGPERDE
jgi:hypothetical protein